MKSGKVERSVMSGTIQTSNVYQPHSHHPLNVCYLKAVIKLIALVQVHEVTNQPDDHA